MNNLKNTDLVLDNYKRSRLIYCIDNMISTSPELEDYIESFNLNHLTTRIYCPMVCTTGYLDTIINMMQTEYQKFTSFDVCNLFIDLLHKDEIGVTFYEKTFSDRTLYTEEELLNKYSNDGYIKFMIKYGKYVSNYRNIQIEKNRNSEIKLKILEV